jgi:hypothetical protein
MKIVSALVGLFLGALLGLGTALAAAGIIGPGARLGGAVDVSGWTSDWTIGSEAANPWTRARVARHGLLALTKDEAVYFTRNTDDAGDRLAESCDYRVRGAAMPAQWWSITLYNSESYLPDNTDNALSYDLTDAASAGDPADWFFDVSASPSGSGSGWVSSRAGGSFDLTLRLYKPDADFIADPERVLQAPSIEKLGCREAN